MRLSSQSLMSLSPSWYGTSCTFGKTRITHGVGFLIVTFEDVQLKCPKCNDLVAFNRPSQRSTLS